MENDFERRAKELFAKYGGEFIEMTSEATVRWRNKVGIVRDNDVAVLSMLPKDAWEFWENN